MPNPTPDSELLYAVSIQGPDDYIAMPDRASAVRLADLLNRSFVQNETGWAKKDDYDLWPLMWATPCGWNGSADAHAKSVSNPSPDYAEAIQQAQATRPDSGLREALEALEKAASRYLAITSKHFSDTDYDRDISLSEADAELEVVALPAARQALSNGEGTGVRVGKLVWLNRSEGSRNCEAITILGDYNLIRDPDPEMHATQWCVWTPFESLGHYEFIEEAKAAAQADYEKRILSALDLPVRDGPTHRHKKRGSEYTLIGTGKMQSESWIEAYGGAEDGYSVDMRKVAIYRSVDDGQFWVRPVEEFNDGRFEILPTPEQE